MKSSKYLVISLLFVCIGVAGCAAILYPDLCGPIRVKKEWAHAKVCSDICTPQFSLADRQHLLVIRGGKHDRTCLCTTNRSLDSVSNTDAYGNKMTPREDYLQFEMSEEYVAAHPDVIPECPYNKDNPPKFWSGPK